MNQSSPLDEHAPREKDTIASPNPDIPLEEQNIVKAVKDLFYIYKKARSKYDRRWIEYYKFFRGQQWSLDRPNYRNSEIINMVWTTIQSNMPLQTDARPKFEFIPENPSDMEFSNILNQLSTYEWDKNNWMMELSSVLLDGYIYGTGISSMNYEQYLNMGIGGTCYQSEDPLYCYPDPDCREINHYESKAFIFARPVNVETVKRKYPSKAHLVKCDIEDFAKNQKTDFYEAHYRDYGLDVPVSDLSYGNSDSPLASTKKTMVITVYLKPTDLVETKEMVESENGQKTELYVLRKKYPKGRMITIASGAVMENTELPYDDQLFPYSVYRNYILPREFYGVSEVEQLESPQKVFNKILSYTLDCLILTANPMWIIDTNACIDTDNIYNIPGGIIEKKPGTEVHRTDGSNVSPALFNMLTQLEAWFNNIAGTQDVSRGQTPGSVTAASAIEQLTDNARTRIKQKMRNMDIYLRDVGQMWLNRVLEFYTAPRVYQVTENDGTRNYFQMSITKNEDGSKVARVSNMNQPNDLKEYMIKGSFDVRVNTGSSLPFKVAEKEQRSLALFDRQIIDAEQVLDDLEHPNKDRILARYQQRMAEQQAMAAQQQGQQ